jgi:DNA-binding NtrC family response regulator
MQLRKDNFHTKEGNLRGSSEKLEMLSVVAYGIHFEVRQRLERVIDELDHSSSGQAVRPYYFYEYFLDPPVVRNPAVSPSPAAFAPFLQRLVVERDFVPFPPGGFRKTSPADFADLVVKRSLRSCPVNRGTMATEWAEFITFEDAVKDSLILGPMYQGWSRVYSDLEMRPYTHDAHEKLRQEIETELSPKMRTFVEGSFSFTFDDGVVSVAGGFSNDFVMQEYLELWGAAVSYESAFREFAVSIYPWLLSAKSTPPTDEIPHRLFELLSVSISSRTIFFGELLLMIPPIYDDRFRGEVYDALTVALRTAATELYAPMLTLYENYTLEVELKSQIENKIAETYRNSVGLAGKDNLEALQIIGAGSMPERPLVPELFPDLSDGNVVSRSHMFVELLRFFPFAVPSTPSESSNLCESLRRLSSIYGADIWLRSATESLTASTPEVAAGTASVPEDIAALIQLRTAALSNLERALSELWADRLVQLETSVGVKDVERSLVFANYLTASPGIVRCIQQAIALRHIRESETVKTTLITGRPGSGKESLARLVKLFSPGYRFGEDIPLNLAILRPKELATAFLIGLDTASEDDPGPVRLKGILQRGRLHETRDGQKPGSRGLTFILDELNSLDVDAQGALLRVLENSELQSIGSTKADKIDSLVIGIMNEDPDVITKSTALEGVLRDRDLLGGLLVDSLYEFLRRSRRLREDLYFRFARGGEINIPDLRNRREDVPILFFWIVKTRMRSAIPMHLRDSWQIELLAYEALMHPAIGWEGNIRELQAVARHAVEAAVRDHQRYRPTASRLEIRKAHALAGIEARGLAPSRY